MIQIDMQMPENCRMCPACSEYDICLIPVDGRGFGEQNVSEFTEGRPEWCPMKEQEAVAHALDILRAHGWREDGYLDAPGEPGIVRCKDCKHGSPYDGNKVICELLGLANSDWFCADGEVKEIEET